MNSEETMNQSTRLTSSMVNLLDSASSTEIENEIYSIDFFLKEHPAKLEPKLPGWDPTGPMVASYAELHAHLCKIREELQTAYSNLKRAERREEKKLKCEPRGLHLVYLKLRLKKIKNSLKKALNRKWLLQLLGNLKHTYSAVVQEKFDSVTDEVMQSISRLNAEWSVHSFISDTERHITLELITLLSDDIQSQERKDHRDKITGRTQKQRDKCLTLIEKNKKLIDQYKEIHTKNTKNIQAILDTWQAVQRSESLTKCFTPKLDQQDEKLVDVWARSRPNDSFWRRAMKSARSAELTALSIYQKLYQTPATDLSILQITNPSDERWKRADIQINRRFVDVKNSFRSYSAQNRYTEHLVKCFKQDENELMVSISAFLSTYIKDYYSFEDQEIIWLGETDKLIVQNLEREYNCDYLSVVFDFGKNQLLPPWIFEYPDKVYAGRNEVLNQMCHPDFEFPRGDYPIAVGVLTNRIQNAHSPTIENEACLLADRCSIGRGISRPRLFLHILDRFCQCIKNQSEFPGKELRHILFPKTTTAPLPQTSRANPLAIMDPVEIIYELTQTLSKVSEYCDTQKIKFDQFFLRGNAILQGKQKNGKKQTIFAYCGGWNHEKNCKCGNTPLYYGKHQNCHTCGYLVCEKCDECQKNCFRPKRHPQRKTYHNDMPY